MVKIINTRIIFLSLVLISKDTILIMKLFLFDAYALIYRAYYAFIKNPRINSKGFNTSAIFGFVNTLEEILKKENPTHLGIAFDPVGPTFRHQAFEQYKAKREKTPEIIRISIPIIKEIISAYKIPILELSNYEADDVIGTIAKKASKNYTTYIMSTDKDYGQLVDEHTFIYKPKHGKERFEILGIKEIKEKYNLTDPLQIIDFFGLMGDSSDNIPGCPGIGEITAKKLISEFGNIENLLKNTNLLDSSLKIKIENNKEIILLSKFLATIKTDIPDIFKPNELVRKEIDESMLQNIFEKLEFRQLASRIFEKKNVKNYKEQCLFFEEFTNCKNDETKIKLSNFNRLISVSHKYFLLEKFSDANNLVKKIKIQKYFAFNIETTDTDPLYAELLGISFASQDGEVYFLSFLKKKTEAEKMLHLFKEILESKTILKIGQNLKYNINVLKKYGICVSNPIFDTLIAHYLINPEYNHDLNLLSETYLNYQPIYIEKLIDGKNQLTKKDIPTNILMNYACESADIILKLKNIFHSIINKNNFSTLFYQIEMPLILVLSDMEEFGVRLDIFTLKDSSLTLKKSLKDIEKLIFQISEKVFNINSPKIVGEILFDHLKIIKNPKKTRLGQYLTSEYILENLKNKHPIVEKILKYRKIKKLLTTYIDTLPNLISKIDGKIHTTYNQSITVTGRLSSTNPNLQNIPIKDAEGKEIRRAFIPDNDCLFLSVDYSQIELRIMAHLSEDKNMLNAFHNSQDIHSATASIIFNVFISDVTTDMRRKAKTTNFSIIYGISIFGLAKQLHISRSEAKELIKEYFIIFPDVKKYMSKSIANARVNGYVETLFHRKRFLPNINSQNSVVRGYAERIAINTPIQGSAADIIKIAMNRIHKQFKNKNLRSRMIMQVHDELNFNVYIDELDKVKQIVIYEMEHVTCLKVPLIVECGVGKNWMEAH